MTCKICGNVRSEERHSATTRPSLMFSLTHGSQWKQHTRKTYCIDCGTYIDSVPREICNALEAARSASSKRDEELADRALKDTTITKRQLVLATRLMLEQVSRLSGWDHEQSAMVQLFLDCVDRATEPPMHFDDNQTLRLRVVDPIADDVVQASIDDGCNSCSYGEVWRQNAEAKMKVLGLHPIWLHRKATTFNGNGVGTSTTSGKLKIPIAILLQEFDRVILGCVHSHEIPEKTHPLLVSQACQANLGMTKRVREGSITHDDHDAQSLVFARQVETGWLMFRIDHLIRDDMCVILFSTILLLILAMILMLTMLLKTQTDCFTRAMVNVRCRDFPRSVLQADTIVVSCGLANFEDAALSQILGIVR